jgi:cytochrome d ubiquinol oxidase subunit II
MLLGFLRPYPILVGLLAVSLFAMHGAIYLYLKTTGELHQQIHGWMWRTFGFFLVTYLLTTIFTLVAVPTAVTNFEQFPWAWAVVILNILAIANVPRAIFQQRPFYAFVSSACVIAASVFLFMAAVYPNLISSSLQPEWSLTIYNAASSQKTLKIMAIIALLGMPFVLTYTTIIYWVFRGKVELDQHSY